MSIGGGGSGGGPVGSGNTFTGPAEALELVGNHAYAYSGSQSIGGAGVEITLLNFTTGNHYIVGHFQFAILQDTANDFFDKVYLNDALITGYLTTGAQSGTDANNYVTFVIPPYSEVKATSTNIDGTANGCVVFVGEVYR